MRLKNIFLTFAAALAPALLQAAPQLKVLHLANEQNILSVSEAPRCLLLPVQDDAPEAKLCVVEANMPVTTVMNVRLARERVDYYVPLDLSAFIGRDVKVDVQGMPQGSLCWKELKLSDTFDMTNKEKYRPLYHHTPAYGWMNDPNGMFYKDGVWHLYPVFPAQSLRLYVGQHALGALYVYRPGALAVRGRRPAARRLGHGVQRFGRS